MGRYISNTSLYQDNELLLLKQGIAKNHKEFLTPGTDTWTIDHDVIVRVRVWGGGGGGGGGYYRYAESIYTQIPGAGGGAGGVAEAILRLSAGTYNITVGDGGAGGKDTNENGANRVPGAAGGSSSFHTYITCSGGRGGSYSFPDNPVVGGHGGVASFNWSGFDGLLYADGRLGGNGGGWNSGLYTIQSASSGRPNYLRIGYGSEKGEGESGGQGGYINGGPNIGDRFQFRRGGGGGGYNAPFIYGVDKIVADDGGGGGRGEPNSGRGVGTGGGGAGGNGGGTTALAGNSGAVVIEWN